MSGKRQEILTTGEFYHVYNRSVGKEEILIKSSNLDRAHSLLEFYRFPQKLRYSFFKRLQKDIKQEYISKYKSLNPVVTIYSFSLMPNHFHLLLKQNMDRGIEKFLTNFQNSYAKYYNTKYKRAGSLFQKPFKAKRLDSDQEFLHVSRYIHLNPVTSFFIKYEDLPKYPWTSYTYYLEKGKDDLIETNMIINLIGSRPKYEKFVANQVDYQKKLHIIKHLTFE